MSLGADRYDLQKGSCKDMSVRRKEVKEWRQLMKAIPKIYNSTGYIPQITSSAEKFPKAIVCELF